MPLPKKSFSPASGKIPSVTKEMNPNPIRTKVKGVINAFRTSMINGVAFFKGSLFSPNASLASKTSSADNPNVDVLNVSKIFFTVFLANKL